MESLPFDVLTNVLANLSSSDLMQARRVCKRWKMAAEDLLSRSDCRLLVASDALSRPQVRSMAASLRSDNRSLIAHGVVAKSALLLVLSRVKVLQVVGMYSFAESSRLAVCLQSPAIEFCYSDVFGHFRLLSLWLQRRLQCSCTASIDHVQNRPSICTLVRQTDVHI